MPYVGAVLMLGEWVDFEYSVNGKTYQFSLPGGGYVSFTDLVEVLGIVGEANAGNNNSVINVAEAEDANGLLDVMASDAAKKFVADVVSVEFSSPELVDVSKVEADTTVGQIKENRGLECDYSAELTEEQIADINAQTVDVGDWALISVQAFDTEEYLTVTMKNGEVFTINVTDDQANPFGLDGNTYSIFGINKENKNSYGLRNQMNNDGSLQATTNSAYASSWTFEYTGKEKLFLIHDDNNNYIIVDGNGVRLTNNKAEAEANPILVHSKEGKYAFTDATGAHGINIYSSGRFGQWNYGNGSDKNFWLTLQSPSDKSKPGTITTADTSGVLQISLFDYGPEDELDKEANNNSSPYSGGINSGHTLQFFSYGKNVGTGINDFTGSGNGPQTGIVADQLPGNHLYPVVASNPTESLDYLFGGVSHSNVEPHTGLNHLFTLDEDGYYHYDSNQNYAYLSGSDFKVYSKTFPEEGADNQFFGVGFFPFNDYDESCNCIHGKNGFENWDPHRSGTTKSGHYDHHFGMSLTGNFIMPPGGKYNGNDVKFQFSGDDDLWVFVDGVLIMDIGGIHNPVSGEINFTTGEVMVHGAAQENFKEKYKRLTGKDWDDSDFSNHDFRVFYMERGGMYSNLEVTFNLPLTPETDTNNFQFNKVSSENESLKLSGAEFALFTDQPCTQPFTLASVPVTATSDDDGVVSFENVPYGQYYMKETVYPQGYQAKDPEEIFTVVVDASGGTITSSSGSVAKVTNQPKKTDVEVEKVWENGSAPAGAQVEVILGRYKLIEDPNAPGTATLVIKDSYSGLPSGSAYHVTYTITGPDGYSQTITKSYTESSKNIEESVEVPAVVAGSQYTVTKQVRDISYHNINNQNQTVNVSVPKNGSGQAQFSQSTFSRNAYSITIYSIDRNNSQTTVSRWVDPTYYSSGSSAYLKCYYKTANDNDGKYARDRRFQYSFDNNSYTDFTLENQGQTNQSGKTDLFRIDHDISIYIKCNENLNWTNVYDWFVSPTIVGADPVQAVSSNRMMMSMRLGASALTASQPLSQTATAPTLPAPPQNTLYVLDGDYADNPDTITLSGGTWTGRKENLPAWNEYGPYVYYIAAVNESGMPDGTTITITNEVTADGSDNVLTVTNTLPLIGALKIQKTGKVQGQDPTEANASKIDGEYTFTIRGKAGTSTAGNSAQIKVTLSGGAASSAAKVESSIPADVTVSIAEGIVTVGGLPVGVYTVSENLTDAQKNAGISLLSSTNTEITVAAVAEAYIPTAAFVNNADLTELNVSKTWDPTSPANHPTNVTFKVYRVGYYMDGENRVPVSEGFYPNENTTYTINGSAVTTVPDLPASKAEVIEGVTRQVLFEYRVQEMPVEGDVVYWPSYTIDGTNITIKNTPVAEAQHETGLSVTKKWLDSDGHDAKAAHAEDEIEFTLRQIPHPTGYVPVTLLYVNADGTTWKQQELFVKKGATLNFTFRKGYTLLNHRVEVTVGSSLYEVGGRGPEYTYTTPAINDATTITARQTFSFTEYVLFEGWITHYDTWGASVEELTYTYQWTSDVAASTGKLYTDYNSFYTDFSTAEPGTANESIYELGKSTVSTSNGTYVGRITGDWAAEFAELPALQKVGNEYVIYTYEISELKIKPKNKDEEIVETTEVDGYQGETVNYLVQWSNDDTAWSIKNWEKPGITVTVKKVAKDDVRNASAAALPGATFMLVKYTGSTYQQIDSSFQTVTIADSDNTTPGLFTFNELKEGYYQLEETVCPDGYVRTSSHPRFRVKTENGKTVVRLVNESGADVASNASEMVVVENAESSHTVTVGNEPGVALPSTGGPGTNILYLLGSLMLAFSGAGLVMRKRRWAR